MLLQQLEEQFAELCTAVDEFPISPSPSSSVLHFFRKINKKTQQDKHLTSEEWQSALDTKEKFKVFFDLIKQMDPTDKYDIVCYYSTLAALLYAEFLFRNYNRGWLHILASELSGKIKPLPYLNFILTLLKAYHKSFSVLYEKYVSILEETYSYRIMQLKHEFYSLESEINSQKLIVAFAYMTSIKEDDQRETQRTLAMNLTEKIVRKKADNAQLKVLLNTPDVKTAAEKNDEEIFEKMEAEFDEQFRTASLVSQ